MSERFRSTVSVEETSFNPIMSERFRSTVSDLIHPYHVGGIPKHSSRRGDLIYSKSCQRDSEAQFPSKRPHSTPIMSEGFLSTVSFEEPHTPLSYQRYSEAQFPYCTISCDIAEWYCVDSARKRYSWVELTLICSYKREDFCNAFMNQNTIVSCTSF